MILEFFTWIENTQIGEGIRGSLWLFPVIESFHLLALAVIGGAILLVDMRLFGVLLPGQPVRRLARDAQPYLIGSLIVMLISGFFLFASEATKCYDHGAFWFKMACLAAAIVFTFTVRRRVANAGDGGVSPMWSKVVAVVSVALWSGVGIGGRWIGFS
jgi:Family of unknown function (DUF6644)